MVKYSSLARLVLISSCLSTISKHPLGSLLFAPAVLALSSRPFVSASNMGNPQHSLHLGGAEDTGPATFHLTISKAAITDEHVVHLEVVGNTTTGHSYMCLDVFKGSDFGDNKLEEVKESGKSATREQKTKAIQQGCDKFSISLGAFHTKATCVAPESQQPNVGAPSKLAAKLVVKPEVEVGKYVLVVGQGSVFRDEPYTHLKQLHINIVE